MALGFESVANGKAEVAELVDATDLKSVGRIGRAGSSPALGTNLKTKPEGVLSPSGFVMCPIDEVWISLI